MMEPLYVDDRGEDMRRGLSSRDKVVVRKEERGAHHMPKPR